MEDVEQLTQRLRADPALRAFFSEAGSTAPIVLTRAPGRLDVMGGVADYSGALVAEATIAEAALVALRPRPDRRLRFWSLGLESEAFTPRVDFDLGDFYGAGTLLHYPAVRAHLTRSPATRWAAYLAGCFYVLLAERLLSEMPHGADVLLNSRVPLGAGVSSSAAIEVATMQALSAALSLRLDGVTLARLAQVVENKVVGAPCGIMDQMTSALGVENALLLILCRPHEVQGTQKPPDGVRVWGINSGVRHSVGGAAYARARVAAFMGRKLLGLSYLTDFRPGGGESAPIPAVPEGIMGRAFLGAYGETGDLVTRVDPDVTYPVRSATEHAVGEQDRVQRFVHLMGLPDGALAAARAGLLMYESHASYARIGLGCAETDLLVGMARAAGPGGGVCGAKITGGGSGGTVALLTHGDAEATVRRIAAEYRQQTGLTPQIFEAGRSPGALAFGHRTIAGPPAPKAPAAAKRLANSEEHSPCLT